MQQKKDFLDKHTSTALSTTINMGNKIEEKIIDVLSRHDEGITIIDISREVSAHRNTVSKYIFGLIKENVVVQRRIGIASLCYLSKSSKEVKR